LLSVSMMIDLGWSVRFEGTESVIQLQDFVLKLNMIAIGAAYTGA
jgi:hypothetical protein